MLIGYSVQHMNTAELKDKTVLVLEQLRDVDVPTRAAAVSYFAMLASIPLLAVVLTLSAQFLPDLSSITSVGTGDLTTKELNSALTRLLPVEANEIIKSEIARLQSKPPVGLLSIGLLLSLWTASNAHVALLNAMYQIYGERNEKSFVKLHLEAVAATLLFAVILIIALIGIIAVPAVINFLNLDYFAGSLMTVAQWAMLYFVVLMGFEANYRFGPCSKLTARRISKGSFFGATMFLIASVGFQLYVQKFGSYSSVYGSLGGAVVFLVWMWMLSACLLIGCAINKVLDDQCRAERRYEQRPFAEIGPPKNF
jgi:membrane protein